MNIKNEYKLSAILVKHLLNLLGILFYRRCNPYPVNLGKTGGPEDPVTPG